MLFSPISTELGAQRISIFSLHIDFYTCIKIGQPVNTQTHAYSDCYAIVSAASPEILMYSTCSINT